MFRPAWLSAILLSVGMLVSCDLAAQEVSTIDIIRTNGGSVWKGRILSYEVGGMVEFETLHGMRISFPEPAVARVKQKLIVVGGSAGRKPYAFKEQGIYHAVSVGISLADEAPGIGMTYALGHRFNRWIGVGGGFGIQNFDLSEGLNVVPVFAEARGFLTETRVSPYYAVRVGYGFAVTNPKFDMVRSKGGAMFNPELGVRFGGGSAVSYYMGLGVHLQRATYDYEWPFSEVRRSDKYLFKRWEVKMGITF